MSSAAGDEPGKAFIYGNLGNLYFQTKKLEESEENYKKALAKIEELKNEVLKAVKTGQCKIIKMNNSNIYLDCDGNTISVESLKGNWKNNKCLVDSDEVNLE